MTVVSAVFMLSVLFTDSTSWQEEPAIYDSVINGDMQLV